ncbi:iron-containing alcohol dehydrogenase family protein [Shewanella sp. cp20]|uniref:iron-containing alcohol dehydrogenase family protein n=1 Tax=Shewanella sp. cp20 TaxID=1521167 RepID=UPI00059FA924|nr:iron-containing alcohol dehydrogenase family protein [Shewanella sp. cp20]KIO37751.1 glycerol dehydrogenase [Shewanella sp. cp20]
MQNLLGKLNTRQLEFPAQLIVQKGAISTSEFLSSQISSRRVLLAIDDGVRELAKMSLPHLHNPNSIIYSVTAADFDNVRQIDMLCAQEHIETVVAFGGGKVLDVCKRLATIRKFELIVVPTALSSDCISSPVAVIFDEQGKKLSLPAAIPNFIVVDTELCAKAPKRLTQAGVGDLLSNYSALLDMDYAKGRANFDGFSYLLAKSAANEILNMEHKPLTDLTTITQLAEGLILSGLAMGFSGDSRPCSGAEHLISHAIDYLQLGTGLHGEQVALGTKYCHFLREQLDLPTLDPRVLNTIERLNIKSTPAALGISKEEFFNALSIAQQMRRDRITFLESLEQIPTEILEIAYENAFEPLGN